MYYSQFEVVWLVDFTPKVPSNFFWRRKCSFACIYDKKYSNFLVLFKNFLSFHYFLLIQNRTYVTLHRKSDLKRELSAILNTLVLERHVHRVLSKSANRHFSESKLKYNKLKRRIGSCEKLSTSFFCALQYPSKSAVHMPPFKLPKMLAFVTKTFPISMEISAFIPISFTCWHQI